MENMGDFFKNLVKNQISGKGLPISTVVYPIIARPGFALGLFEMVFGVMTQFHYRTLLPSELASTQ